MAIDENYFKTGRLNLQRKEKPMADGKRTAIIKKLLAKLIDKLFRRV